MAKGNRYHRSIETLEMNHRFGSVRLLVALQSAYLRGAMKAGNSLFHIANVLNPIATWLKWAILGVPSSRIQGCTDRFALLELAARAAKVEGLWLEFGVWQAGSLNHLARLTPRRLYGFDSFEGLPERWTPSMRAGAFSTGGVLPRTAENVVLVKGWFQDTLPALIHIDCDLYKSARFVLLELRSRIRPGTVIVFDEFATIMPDDEAKAFKEYVRLTGTSYRYLGFSADGSIALTIV
jgi:hypothetical protein